jgi:hypothetical protein
VKSWKIFHCKELPETAKGQDIFNILSSYLESCGLSWNHCVGICTGGAPSVIGSIKSFVTHVREKIITTTCLLHREVLVSKTTGEDLEQVRDVAVIIVSFIK